jgi:hypothetical protein
MANTIQHKRSSTGGSVPTAGSLSYGELALNTADGSIYMKKSDDSVIKVAQDLGSFNTDLLPDADNTRSLGSASLMWKDVFVGPGSLYVNGQKVLEEDSGTIVVSADDDQNLQVKTGGAGDIEFYPSGAGVIQMKGTLSVLAGKHFTSSDSNPISVAVGFDMNNEKISDLATPTVTSDAATKGYVDTVAKSDSEIRGLFSASGDASYNDTTGQFSVTTFKTADARNSVSVTDNGGDGSLTYNSTTGVITYTGPSATEVRSHFSNGVGVTITSGQINIGQSVATTASPTFSSVTINGAVTNATHAATKAYVDSATSSVGDAATLGGEAGSYYLDFDNATNKPDPTITLGGDATGSATLTDLTSQTLTVSVVDDSHNHSSSTGNFTVGDDLSVGGDATITGNLTVSGTTTSVNTNEVNIGDNIMVLNSDETGAPSQDAGIEIERGTSSNVQFVWDEGNDRWTAGTEDMVAANFIGALTGNADTATILATSRTIELTGDVTGSASFNGSANASITATVADNSHSHTSANISDATSANVNNVIVKRDASGNFSAGTVTATLSGNASTATALQTARTVNGVSFDGSANIQVDPYIDDLETGDTNCPITFTTDSTAGYKGLHEDSSFYYDTTNNTVYAGTFSGTATQAQYADLAEMYTSDADYEPGTVVAFGGEEEVTRADVDMDAAVAGVVSTNPAYLMNKDLDGVAVALRGRVPCKVTGKINKGSLLVSAGNGMARAEETPIVGSVIGKALEDFNGDEGVIEIVVS